MNEIEYTNEVIIPLLKHMGYMEVTYTHGIDEFGKDIIFSEYDRFGNKKYHAAQVKIGDISGGNKSIIQNIINQITIVFNMEFPDLITKTNVSVSDLFIITSGRFVGNAKTILLEDKRLLPFRHRIHFYQGHHIEELFEKSYKDVKELYVAQLNELNRNIQLGQLIEEFFSKKNLQIKYINFNLPKLINKLSMFEDQEPLRKELELYQLQIEKNNDILSYIPIMKAIMGSEREINIIIQESKEIIGKSERLIESIKKALAEI